MGGGLSYYTTSDQKDALEATAPNGVTFESHVAQYHISYMISPDYQTMTRIREAGMPTGCKFRIIYLKSSAASTRGTAENTGVHQFIMMHTFQLTGYALRRV